MNRPPERIVIVGAGIAALSAAERLRELGWAGQLTIVGDEAHRPYNRTPLSKQLLTGTRVPSELHLSAFTALDAVWRTATPARGLDLAGRAVLLPGGERLPFDGMIIASGVEARHLPGAPVHSPRVHMLRALDDALAIDAALARARHLVVIGGGFIGCELAATATERAIAVSIVEPAPALLAGVLGEQIGGHATDLHRRHGVTVHLGATVVQGHTTDPRGIRLTLSDGHTLHADLAVVGVGTTPRTDWLTTTSVDVSDGVACGPTCHVLDAHGHPIDGVVAAGDVARWPNLRFDPVPRRVEHWINAIEMGRHAAAALLTGPAAAAPFAPVPRFWSQQHGVRIQSVGLPRLGTRVRILEGSTGSGRFIAGYLRPDPRTARDVLVGAVGFDSPRALLGYRDRIGQPTQTGAAAA